MAKRQRKKRLTKAKPLLEKCPECGSTLLDAPGIGLYCPNKKCEIVDGPFDGSEPIPWIPPTFPLIYDKFEFFNDTKKPVVIRTTEKSYPTNAIKFDVLPQHSVKLAVRPGGFIKLWEFENSFHLLVE